MSVGRKSEVKLKLVSNEIFESKIESVEKPKMNSGRVIKAADLNREGVPVHTQVGTPRESIESLKQNLRSLNQLHSRLRFMLKELEELVQEE